jgi:predicted dehydrogenase
LLYARRGDRTLLQIAHEESDQQTAGEDHRVPPVARLVRRFLDSVSGGPAVRPSFADGVRAQELIEAARRSASDRVWVQVSSGRHAR